MKTRKLIGLLTAVLLSMAAVAYAAYHHEGEMDANKFLAAYPDTAGTKLDHCALCHGGGEYESKGKMVSLGSCQWCHYAYGYDGAGEIEETINAYGAAYKAAGRNAAAVASIDALDSDNDGYTNAEEIAAMTFPGSAGDHPGLGQAPYRIYTRAQLEAMDQHTQFLLMSGSRSDDDYTEYTGVPMKDLLDDAGITESATGITVFAPDGWAQYHPLYYDEDPELYHVYGNMPGAAYQYPPANFYYNQEADLSLNPDYGWANYSAPSCAGRSNGDAINVDGGLKALLAITREGTYLDPGVLSTENKLDGEGPFRVVVPQKTATPPDQSSRADEQEVVWPYENDWDHNAGSCSRSATIIRVEPMPEGTTDIDILEAGWNYVDQEKVILYGAIDGTDSNGNGVLDSEEKIDDQSDNDNDGTPDYMDTDTARVREATGGGTILIHCDKGDLVQVAAFGADDPAVSETGKPAIAFPHGALRFNITGITPGAFVDVKIEFPEDVPKDAELYKITDAGWQKLDFGSNNGDATITVRLTDGDPATDADGMVNGIIVDPSALGVPEGSGNENGGGDDGGTCFIMTVLK